MTTSTKWAWLAGLITFVLLAIGVVVRNAFIPGPRLELMLLRTHIDSIPMLEFRVTNHSRLFIEGGSLTVELYDASQKYLGLALLSLTNLHPGKSITALAIPIDVDTSHITSFQAQIMMLFDAKANSIGRLFTIEVVDPP